MTSISTLDCIASRVDSDKVSIFGMQKCGSGTLSEYQKDDPRIGWNQHGTFFNKKYYRKNKVDDCLIAKEITKRIGAKGHQ